MIFQNKNFYSNFIYRFQKNLQSIHIKLTEYNGGV